VKKNHGKGCPLCRREHLTLEYYQDRACWIVDALDQDGAKKRIMGVVKVHHPNPSQWLKLYVRRQLARAADRYRPVYGRYILEEGMRTVKDHWHIYARFG